MKRISIKTCLTVAALGVAGAAPLAAQTGTPVPGSPGSSMAAKMDSPGKPAPMDMSMEHDMMSSEAAPKGMMCGGNMNSGGAGGGSKGMMCGGGMNPQATNNASKGGMCGGGTMDHHGMMQREGMQGMMAAMQARDRAMASAQGGRPSALPHLPPGNEKLEFQMHAEMMQKLGEIALKYAERVKDAP